MLNVSNFYVIFAAFAEFCACLLNKTYKIQKKIIRLFIGFICFLYICGNFCPSLIERYGLKVLSENQIYLVTSPVLNGGGYNSLELIDLTGRATNFKTEHK